MSEMVDKANETLSLAFDSISRNDPSVYDAFSTERGVCAVPWADRTHRKIAVEKNSAGVFVNSAPLPNGTPAGQALYVGSIYRGQFTG